jgi:hypothetical protein
LFLDKVQEVVYGFLRVVARHRRFDVCEELTIVLDCLEKCQTMSLLCVNGY